jgi:hypothetical protein
LGAALLSPAKGEASTLIGKEVRFQCTNCGPPTDDRFTVVASAPELTLFDQFQIDVEARSLKVNWIFDNDSIISDLNFVWSDLDLDFSRAVIDPSSTWGADASILFTDRSVSLTNNADLSVRVGDFTQVNLIPLPAALPLLISALLAFGAAASIRTRRL